VQPPALPAKNLVSLPASATTTGATISSSGDGHDQDPTRRIPVPGDPPVSRSGYAGEPLEGEAGLRPEATSEDARTDLDLEEEPEPRRGRDIGILLAGVLAGILLTFVVIALTTGGDTTDVGDDPAAAEREAELAEREQRIEELDARIADLDAQLAEVDGDSADRDAELAAQREALDERLAAIDARMEELDNRQAALDDRAEALDQREAAIADAENDAGSPNGGSDGGSEDDGGDGGIDLDDLGDSAEGVIERVLEEIRNLFGQN